MSVAAIAAALPARAEVMSESGEATGATLTESVELGSLMSQAVETEAATAEPDAAVMTAEADMPTVADVLEDSVAETQWLKLQWLKTRSLPKSSMPQSLPLQLLCYRLPTKSL
ncbi:MAG: hypothetical protein HC839_00125 [Leptolyngbyaceae cyanobacterium RM2_2_21]|nr:hypothetical protein [Leptolyngbyaceae cyanobacterium RM2_2_21]